MPLTPKLEIGGFGMPLTVSVMANLVSLDEGILLVASFADQPECHWGHAGLMSPVI